jgi:uncharacterized lipoprotein YmbA
MKNMIRTIRYLVTFCLVILAGCGSSPPVHYYALETMDNRVAVDAEGSPILAVGAFRMPEYLNRSQMVMRGSGAEIIVDDFNRWAEPLDDSIHRVLVVVAYPSSAVLDIDYRLIGRFDRFTADQDGLVVLDAQWAIANSTGVGRLSPRRVRFESQATIPDDPGSIAQAMSNVLAQFCRDIAGEIDSIGLDPAN